MPSTRPSLRLVLFLSVIAVGLSACGKRGQLDAPPAQTAASGESVNKLGGRKKTPITAPKRDLPIDWILD
jgi:predicted small lipoprotein YifL